jgi:hypothetical protein
MILLKKSFVFFFYLIISVLLFSCSNVDSKKDDKSLTSKSEDSSTIVNSKVEKVLFKEYKDGQSISEFNTVKGYSDCTDFFGVKSFCKEGVSFLGNDFSAGFIFTETKLDKVILYTEYNEDLFTKIIASLPKNGFTPILLNDSKNGIYDLINAIKTKGEANAQQKMMEFVFQMASDEENDYFISYVEHNNVDKKISKALANSKTASEVVGTLPSNTRYCDLGIIIDDDRSYITIGFYTLDSIMKVESF